MHNSEPENFKKSDPCCSPKILGQPRAAKRSCTKRH